MESFDFNNINFCGAEFVDKKTELQHPRPHTHEYYELYFLHHGQRDVFIENDMFALQENCLAIIPPLCYHKTEGSSYARTNLTFYKMILDKSQSTYLDSLSNDKAIVINDRYLGLIQNLLSEACEIKSSNSATEIKNERIAQIVRTILMFLSMQNNTPIKPAISAKRNRRDKKNTTSEMLRVAQYINNNYTQKITLDDICKKFLISKTALNLKFKDVMQTTVVDYLLSARLKRATYLLKHTRLSIEEISQSCGFSSANYFGLIFKKKIGTSPSAFHKHRKSLKPKKRPVS